MLKKFFYCLEYLTNTNAGPYIILATKSQLVSMLQGHHIYRVTGFEILPLKEFKFSDTVEDIYINLLRGHINSAPLYFSRTWDLTNAYQRQTESGQHIWSNADERFFWNKYVSQDLIDSSSLNSVIGAYVMPLIYGYVNIVHTTICNQLVTFGLITRRSRWRAGTRYFRRGTDNEGNVANFNETEQILCIPTPSTESDLDVSIYSYVQTRGSIPVHWAEINHLTYRPKMQIYGNAYESAKKHFSQQKKIYGKNYLVNLVNQKGYELPVKHAYEQVVEELDDPLLSYVYFDFHHECSKMRWDRVQLLINTLEELGLDKQKWFQAKFGAEKCVIEEEQTSVVRTNCMDCLDRTNVVQSQLARFVLQKQLEAGGIVAPGTNWWDFDNLFLGTFRGMWADNADVVSKSYSGTGALKTDFTRLGRRTYFGALGDFRNSLTRYARNNLWDGPRQDGFDLFLGAARAYDTAEDPFADHRPLLYQTMPYFFSGSLVMLTAALAFPKENSSSAFNRFFFVFWFGILTYSFKFIMDNGLQYVNWPRLVKLDFLKRVAIKTAKSTRATCYLMREVNEGHGKSSSSVTTNDIRSLEEGKRE